MKSLTLILTLIANVALAGNNVGQQGETVDSQVNVTHDIVQQVLAELRNRPLPQETYSHPDFLAAANRFDALAERALLNFESKLREEILPQTRPYLARLESISNATIYNSDQKDLLFVQQRHEAGKFIDELEMRYKSEIYRVLTVDFPEVSAKLVGKCYHRFLWHFTPDEYYYLATIKSVHAVTVKSEVHSTVLGSSNPVNCGINDEGKINEIKEAWPLLRRIPEIKDVIYQKVIRSQCATSSCALLLADHIKNYIYSVKKNIDIKMGFPFNLWMFPLDLNDEEISLLTGFLTPLEKDTAGLPFDITPAEFEKIKNKTE